MKSEGSKFTKFAAAACLFTLLAEIAHTVRPAPLEY
jgi:hypothetical protein